MHNTTRQSFLKEVTQLKEKAGKGQFLQVSLIQSSLEKALASAIKSGAIALEEDLLAI